MKKITFFITALSMAAMVLSGCGLLDKANGKRQHLLKMTLTLQFRHKRKSRPDF